MSFAAAVALLACARPALAQEDPLANVFSPGVAPATAPSATAPARTSPATTRPDAPATTQSGVQMPDARAAYARVWAAERACRERFEHTERGARLYAALRDAQADYEHAIESGTTYAKTEAKKRRDLARDRFVAAERGEIDDDPDVQAAHASLDEQSRVLALLQARRDGRDDSDLIPKNVKDFLADAEHQRVAEIEAINSRSATRGSLSDADRDRLEELRNAKGRFIPVLHELAAGHIGLLAGPGQMVQVTQIVNDQTARVVALELNHGDPVLVHVPTKGMTAGQETTLAGAFVVLPEKSIDGLFELEPIDLTLYLH